MRGLKSYITGFTAVLLACPVFAQIPDPDVLKGRGITGDAYIYKLFPSSHVKDRNVEVWLPPSYTKDRKKRYPVIYMQDGQNVINPASSYGGTEWGLDETMTRLIKENKAPEAIIVGIWNTGQLRGPEYMPQTPYYAADPDGQADALAFIGMTPISDKYLLFLTEELKPFIDGRYRTLKDRQNTVIMGSSMGGLISLYAMCEYPQVFGAAGCISTHWPIGKGIMVDYLAERLPDPRTHRIYFDHGTRGLDSAYAPYQEQVDSLMEKDGFVQGKTFASRVFKGETHAEISWKKRVELPLRFLLPKPLPKRPQAKSGFTKK